MGRNKVWNCNREKPFPIWEKRRGGIYPPHFRGLHGLGETDQPGPRIVLSSGEDERTGQKTFEGGQKVLAVASTDNA